MENVGLDFKCPLCKLAGQCSKELKSKNAAKHLFLAIERNQWVSLTDGSKTEESIRLNINLIFKTLKGSSSYKLVATLDQDDESYNSGHWTCRKFIKQQLWECTDAASETVADFQRIRTC